MAENVIALPSRFNETICRIWCLVEQIRVLEAELEAARRHAAREFAAQNGWFYVLPEDARLVDKGRFGALADARHGPDSRVDLFAEARPLPSRPSRLVAVVHHVIDPSGPEAALIRERARHAGLQVLPPGDDSWFWPGESVAYLISATP